MLRITLLIAFVSSLLFSCNTKFSVNGEYVETPIVHFLLDQGQKYQFLKLNKTFLKEGNANEFAKDAELSYFDNVDAKVEEVMDGKITRTWPLRDTIIENKKEGVFYGPEQKLYYFKADDLQSTATYRLSIDIDNGNHTVTGETELIRGVEIKYPMINQSFNFADNDVIANGYKSTSISFSKGEGAGAYKMQINFNYKEITASGETQKSVQWNVGEITNSDVVVATPTFRAEGERFYEMLSNKIKADPSVLRRNLTGIDIVLTAGSNDLYTYMLTNAPSSSLAQNKPVYSNVDGALGIFSSRCTIKQEKVAFKAPATRCLNVNSTKELCEGKYTAGLKFCSDIPNDNSYPYYCN